MQNIELFPFVEYLWLYLSFIGFVLLMLVVDLGIFHREAHAVTYREAITWSVVWISLAVLFNIGLYYYCRWKFSIDPRLQMIPGFDSLAAARQVALEFLTGYVVEKSLSIDNIFVFVLVFNYFSIPRIYQHRILFYGILGALIFRAFFIALGAVLLDYHWVVLLFGVFLILTGLKMLLLQEEGIYPEKNPVIRFLMGILPVTHEIQGQHFLVRKNGMVHATPLLVSLAFLEVTDIIFAVDSVPAIYAITSEPLIVFTSNLFAILGLRSLYFLLAGAVHQFHLLKPALAFVLIFVGLKMAWLNDLYGGKFPISISLLIIGTLVALGIVLSLVFPKQEKETT